MILIFCAVVTVVTACGLLTFAAWHIRGLHHRLNAEQTVTDDLNTRLGGYQQWADWHLDCTHAPHWQAGDQR